MPTLIEIERTAKEIHDSMFPLPTNSDWDKRPEQIKETWRRIAQWHHAKLKTFADSLGVQTIEEIVGMPSEFERMEVSGDNGDSGVDQNDED